MRLASVMAAAVAVVAGSASAGAAAHRSADQAFIDRADSIHRGALDAARLAARKGDPEVRRLAERLEGEHRASLQRLRDLAAKDDLVLPGRMQDSEVQLFKRLDSASGPAFDESYVAAMTSVEADAAALFQEEASGGRDADVRAYAAGELPTLRAEQASLGRMAPR